MVDASATGPPPLDVMISDCRARTVLTLLAERWALLVIDALSDQALRTSALRRRISGVSEKMLIQTLRTLEAVDIVERRDFGEVPPRVEYALTERGRSLSPLISAFDRWVEANAFDMLAGRTEATPATTRPRKMTSNR